MTPELRAPFPWFGGKSRVAHLVWAAFGADVPNYVEPFAGSLAVLLGRPSAPRIETVNDRDGYLVNFWRAVQAEPRAVAEWADWPVPELDLHARHRWLVDRAEFREAMRKDPEFYDVKVAGWWVWGLCQWIGGGWCAESNWAPKDAPRSRGRATATEKRRPNLHNANGVLRDLKRTRNLATSAEWKKRPSLGKGGRGVQRAMPSAEWLQLPVLGGSRGAANRGIHASGLHQKLPKMDRGGASRLQSSSSAIAEWFSALQERLRRVRIVCGDWKRVLGRSSTELIGTTGIFLDPPYHAEVRDPSLYGVESADVSTAVREWAIKHGRNKRLRIAVCGYEGEHEFPSDWQCVSWKAAGGYAAAAGNTENSARERIWFSPHCERAHDQVDLFDLIGGAA